MRSLERVRALIAGQPVDHLPVQPVIMMFAARHFGIPFIDYTRDGRKMAAAQSKLVHDFGIDCLLTCSDPAREVIDIAGEGSVNWYEDQGPAICEERAALLDKSRLKTFRIPDPLGGGRMHDRIKGIEAMHQEFGGEVSIVGWVEGPLALGQELRGLTRSMMDFMDDPAFMKDLLDFTAEVAVVYAEAEIQSGADTIGMSDAAASMMGPKYYREFLFPRQLRVVESIRQAHPEVIVRLHMCGNTDSLDSANEATARAYLRIGFPYQPAGGASLPGTGSGDSGQCLDHHRHVGRKPGAGLRGFAALPQDLREVPHCGHGLRSAAHDAARESARHGPVFAGAPAGGV